MKYLSVVVRTITFLLLLAHGALVECLWCDRTPVGTTSPKSPGDNGFKIVITGAPEKYIPGAVYTVRLQAPEEQFIKFSGFLLVAEPTGGQSTETASGSFQLTSDSLARFSEYCSHAVRQASELPKSEVQIRWTAPQNAAGCVVFKATISQSRSQWYMDDGELTKELCPESEDGLEENETGEPCCACDEAKYEMTFEGLWSALTHPKDFPADTLSAHFGDVIGASHSPSYRFWEYSGESSDGLRNLAERGDTQELESELKDQSTNIRTIIKARGLKNPKFYGYRTSAVFRADKDNNLVSIVSKIVPSPDWFVGISGVNLCLRNCSWSQEKVLNLYPWDAGTNDGISYTTEGEPMKDQIRRIVWNSDENSPFYDPTGNIVKPFARLHLVKQRSYDKACENDLRRDVYASDNADSEMYDESEHQNIPECQVSFWSEWTPCPVTCGRGTQTRYRNYINPAKAARFGCNRRRIEKKNCYNTAGCTEASLARYGSNNMFPSLAEPTRPPALIGGSSDTRVVARYCGTTEWSQWSPCSVTCGRGRRSRDRQFLYPQLAADHNCILRTQEHEICYGAVRDCSTGENVQQAGCETTQWSEWGQCTVTCGQGVRSRTRFFTNNRADHRHCNLEMMEYQTCTGVRSDCTGPEDMKGDARDQGQATVPTPVRCEVSEWSEWSRCRGTCGMKTRHVISYNFNGGKACPSLMKSKSCDENSAACRAEQQSSDVYGRPSYNRNG